MARRRMTRDLLAAVEARLWDVHDEHLKAKGFQVAKPSRWTRRYRNPRIVVALAAAAARLAEDDTDPTAPAFVMERAA
jgi:hypothetical protein